MHNVVVGSFQTNGATRFMICYVVDGLIMLTVRLLLEEEKVKH